MQQDTASKRHVRVHVDNLSAHATPDRRTSSIAARVSATAPPHCIHRHRCPCMEAASQRQLLGQLALTEAASLLCMHLHQEPSQPNIFVACQLLTAAATLRYTSTTPDLSDVPDTRHRSNAQLRPGADNSFLCENRGAGRENDTTATDIHPPPYRTIFHEHTAPPTLASQVQVWSETQ